MKSFAFAALLIALPITACAPVDMDAAEWRAGMPYHERVVATDEGGFRMGAADAPVSIVEYASPSCIHCRDLDVQVTPRIEELVDAGKISYELRHYVLGQQDVAIAALMRCEGPGELFDYNHKWFANWDVNMAQVRSSFAADSQSVLAAEEMPIPQRYERLAEIADLKTVFAGYGLPASKAQTCLADAATAKQINDTTDTAMYQLGIMGTPTILIDGAQFLYTGPQSLLTRLDEIAAQ